jgi:hypothetical protein
MIAAAPRGVEAQHQQQAASRLRHAGGRGHDLAGPVADALVESARSLPAVSAEPAEQLLGAVADEQRADDDPKDQQSDAHRNPSLPSVCTPFLDSPGSASNDCRFVTPLVIH